MVQVMYSWYRVGVLALMLKGCHDVELVLGCLKNIVQVIRPGAPNDPGKKLTLKSFPVQPAPFQNP